MRSCAALLACAFALAATGASALPRFDEVKAAYRPSDATVLDRHGVPVQTLRVDDSVRRLPWVALADMSPALLHAVVLSEDRRFHEHSGVDWAAVARGAWANLWNTRTRGASTLTMQLAGLIDEGLARPPGGRSVAQKIEQAITATRLDAAWRKSEILEAYLNSVAFRGEVVGINALSQTLFGKHPGGLDAHEAAIAAALVRGPNAKPEVVAARACGVLQLQRLPCAGVRGLTELALARRGGMPLGEQIAPHFARRVLAQGHVAPLRSSLDAGVQRVAIAALQRHLNELSGRNVEDGAVLVLDNASGEVLAWVGSSGSLSAAAQVDGVLARRQPGSALKPFVYGLAFERRLITPASLIDDSPAQIATSGGLYLPQNYDEGYKGWVSARTALGASLNIPAVRVAALIGPDALHARLNALGFDLKENAWHYGHSLALGGAEVTLLALSNAYRSLANGGTLDEVRLWPAPAAAVDKAVDKQRNKGQSKPGDKLVDKPRDKDVHKIAGASQAAVMPPEVAFLLGDILADNNARVATFGTDSALRTRGFAAVKTGTSKDMRDNWCIGYTDRYTIGVWVGNASGAPMHALSGVSGAAPVWQALVRHLHRDRVSMPPRPPPGLVRSAVRFQSGHEPPREELFLAGTAQPLQRPSTEVSPGTAFGIGSPADGSIFAFDPDMPGSAQRIRFEGESGAWRLNGRQIGHGRALWWIPIPGQHKLTLVGPEGQPIQTVRFEVRRPPISAPKDAAGGGANRPAKGPAPRPG